LPSNRNERVSRCSTTPADPRLGASWLCCAPYPRKPPLPSAPAETRAAGHRSLPLSGSQTRHVAFQRQCAVCFGRFRKKFFRSVKQLPHSWCIDGVQSSASEAIGFVLSRAEAEEMMYRIAYLARESSGDFTIVLTFALLGLALSLLAIGRGGLIDPEYMADLLLLF
jgi:hypothetical protein